MCVKNELLCLGLPTTTQWVNFSHSFVYRSVLFKVSAKNVVKECWITASKLCSEKYPKTKAREGRTTPLGWKSVPSQQVFVQTLRRELQAINTLIKIPSKKIFSQQFIKLHILMGENTSDVDSRWQGGLCRPENRKITHYYDTDVSSVLSQIGAKWAIL